MRAKQTFEIKLYYIFIINFVHAFVQLFSVGDCLSVCQTMFKYKLIKNRKHLNNYALIYRFTPGLNLYIFLIYFYTISSKFMMQSNRTFSSYL